MNTRLDCEIVRDLLPSYVDGLTSSITNQAVEAHLEGCADCSEVLRHMREPKPVESKPTEVDYLKKVRRHATRRSLLIGIVLMLLGMTILSYRFLYVGTAAEASDVACNISVTGNRVTIGGTLANSRLAVSRVTFSESSGMVQAKVYTAPKTFFNSGEFKKTYAALSNIVQVRIDDQIVWENGTEISRTAALLYKAKNPYVGDMPADGRIATILGVYDLFGSYKSQLHTAAEPYGWTLTLSTPIAADEETVARDVMTADSYMMLAAIDNLGFVTWEYQTDSGPQDYTVTVEDASAFAGRDIKQCAETASDLQALVQSLSIKRSYVRETLQEDGTFWITVADRSDADIAGFVMDYYLNGKRIGSRSGENAEGSALSKNKAMGFDFTPADFPEGTGSAGLSGFSFDLSVVGKDGSKTTVCKGQDVAAKYAWTFYFSLTGDYENGFVLNEG